MRCVNIAQRIIVSARQAPAGLQELSNTLGSKYAYDSSTGLRAAATLGMIMLLLGVFVILTIQPPSSLEPGSGMGNYKMPGSSQGGQGGTPPATTSGSGPGTTPSVGNAPAPSTAVGDFLIPANDTANN